MERQLKERREKAFKIILRYGDKTYVVFDDLFIFDGDSDEISPTYGSNYMWEEGNYSCDCNRSLFIQRQCDPDFPEMECGEKIEMVQFDWA